MSTEYAAAIIVGDTRIFWPSGRYGTHWAQGIDAQQQRAGRSNSLKRLSTCPYNTRRSKGVEENGNPGCYYACLSVPTLISPTQPSPHE
jgi:hypothetical protein